MSTEAPAETLAGITFDHVRDPFPGPTAEQIQQLGAALDMGRVKQKPGRGVDYLPEHDVLRTANRIFGFGRWGTDVVELVLLNEIPGFKGPDNKVGYYVGYRCTVRLTVAGCVPVCGVGYGDGVEYQPQAPVTAHELAVKEAESDAIKRAFKKFGDQFGLILYAKEGDRRRIAAELAEAERAANPPQLTAEQFFGDTGRTEAKPEDVDEVLVMATKAGIGDVADQAVADHREKNRMNGYECVISDWLERLAERVLKEGVPDTSGEPATADSPFAPPAGAQTTTDAVESAFGEGAQAA